MKKFRQNIDRFYDDLDERWRALPLRRQRRYTLYFFAGYLLLTAGIVAKVWYETITAQNNMRIEHIENPVFKKNKRPAKLQDTLPILLKNRIYERK